MALLLVREQSGIEGQGSEDTQDLADIAPERAGALVLDTAIPLDPVMLWRIPDKWIADRRSGRFRVLRQVERGRRHLVEDRADRIQPGKAVRMAPLVALIPRLSDLGHILQLSPEDSRRVRCRAVRPKHTARKAVEFPVVLQCRL